MRREIAVAHKTKSLLPWVAETLPRQVDGARRALREEPSYEEALVQFSAFLLTSSSHHQLAALAAAALLRLAEPMTIAGHAQAAVDAFAALNEAGVIEGSDEVALEDARAALDQFLED
jgi:hypothetical protein